MYQELTHCRICGNSHLVPLLSLGNLALTGIFPKTKNEITPSGPLELVKCEETKTGHTCGLVQLRHNYQLDILYGNHYGYRSGLNKSMVNHLRSKVGKIIQRVSLSKDDLIIDIGSNDSTLLQAYPKEGLTLIGIDPTGNKFKNYYPAYVSLIPDFFSSERIKQAVGNKKAKVITSIAMFYDLEAPVDFVRQIYDVLADDGIWVFEQSYMPTMLDMNAYDTICHEHLEYYGLKQIKWITDHVGFKIIDVELNDVNGGSFSVTVAKNHSPYQECSSLIAEILSQEVARGLDTLVPYKKFEDNILRHREELVEFIQRAKREAKMILGYGASTKGNVILQFCHLTTNEIPYIGEVNEDKFGSYTPGTLIPIVDEKQAKAMKPDYLMVLPWHFKKGIVSKEQEYLKSGGHLFFPLPELEVV